MAKRLEDLLQEYQRLSAGKLSYEIVEPKTPEEMAQAKQIGLEETALGDRAGTSDAKAAPRGYAGVVLEYRGQRETITRLPTDHLDGVEYFVVTNVREILDRAEGTRARIGVVTGKKQMRLGDPNLVPPRRGTKSPSLKSIIDQALPFYDLTPVELHGGNAAVDPTLAGLIITQPGEGYSEDELRRIDEFLMRGNKAVLVVAGAVNIQAGDGSMRAVLDAHGLDQLLAGYGIELRPEAIVDHLSSVSLPVKTRGGEPMLLRAAGVVTATHQSGLDDELQPLDSRFPGFFLIDELPFPFPSTLVAHPDKQPEAELKVVARSSPYSTVEKGSPVDMSPRPTWTKKGPSGQRAMAIAIEGRLRSAFVDDKSQTISVPDTSLGPNRVLVISAAQFLCNPFAHAGNPPPVWKDQGRAGGAAGDPRLQALAWPYAQRYLTTSILAFKHTLDWMMANDDLLACAELLVRGADAR